MRCTSPRTVGFYDDGKTICWSPKKYSKQFPTFQIPCSKCISCRLESARQTAVRCVHEAQMHEQNSFITLTYDEENLTSEKLQYQDFQNFVKRLRHYIYDEELKRMYPYAKTQMERRAAARTHTEETRKDLRERLSISVFVAGEYGDRKKRPHWHALIFNWRPPDCEYKYSNERGDQVYSSRSLSDLWPFGISEIGSITLESAGYCARYASKKLTHGPDGTHDFEPISRRSSKNAIGKKWIEKFWPDVFNLGFLVLPNGQQCGIPRYYEKWFKKTHPTLWEHYVTVTKQKIIDDAIKKEAKISLEEKKINLLRSAQMGLDYKRQRTRNEARKKILEQKFKQLNQHLKL